MKNPSQSMSDIISEELSKLKIPVTPFMKTPQGRADFQRKATYVVTWGVVRAIGYNTLDDLTEAEYALIKASVNAHTENS